jgi:hypothetical protein
MAKSIRQPLTYQTCDDVSATGGKGDDQPHRPRRIDLRPRDARHCRQRGKAGGQMQKSAAGKFYHGVIPLMRLNECHARNEILLIH